MGILASSPGPLVYMHTFRQTSFKLATLPLPSTSLTNTSYPGPYSLEDYAGHFQPFEERLAYIYSRSSSTTKQKSKVTAQHILILQKTRIIRNVNHTPPKERKCRFSRLSKSFSQQGDCTTRQYLRIHAQEINSHEINSHEVNSHQINFPRDQLP